MFFKQKKLFSDPVTGCDFLLPVSGIVNGGIDDIEDLHIDTDEIVEEINYRYNELKALEAFRRQLINDPDSVLCDAELEAICQKQAKELED